MNEDRLQALTERSLALGFEAVTPLDPQTLAPKPSVREMCAENRCGAYGKNWTCPPAVGTLEECAERLHRYESGLLLQTVGQLRRSIDTRKMAEAESLHAERLTRLAEDARSTVSDFLLLGAGGCRLCQTCAYPEPCRFPAKAIIPMEGCGLFVTEVCRACGAAYHHGDKTVTFTGCILF